MGVAPNSPRDLVGQLLKNHRQFRKKRICAAQCYWIFQTQWYKIKHKFKIGDYYEQNNNLFFCVRQDLGYYSLSGENVCKLVCIPRKYK